MPSSTDFHTCSLHDALPIYYIPAGTLSFLFYTYPAWVAIIARLRRLEPLTPTRLVALAMSLFGVVVMVGSPTAAALDPRGRSAEHTSELQSLAYLVCRPRLE